jgi:hypothetical protein
MGIVVGASGRYDSFMGSCIRSVALRGQSKTMSSVSIQLRVPVLVVLLKIRAS